MINITVSLERWESLVQSAASYFCWQVWLRFKTLGKERVPSSRLTKTVLKRPHTIFTQLLSPESSRETLKRWHPFAMRRWRPFSLPQALLCSATSPGNHWRPSKGSRRKHSMPQKQGPMRRKSHPLPILIWRQAKVCPWSLETLHQSCSALLWRTLTPSTKHRKSVREHKALWFSLQVVNREQNSCITSTVYFSDIRCRHQRKHNLQVQCWASVLHSEPF